MRVCILADDLTGANATAALLKREGLPTHTHLSARPPHGAAPASLRHDGAHVLDLDTRERTDAEAAARMAIAIGWLGDAPDLVGLRIDSTLRGPIPASLDALLTDKRRLALMVPAFPASGRTTRDGIHYVYGVPLAETQVAHDPQCPVTELRVATWIGARLVAAWAMLDLGEVRCGPQAIAARFAHLFSAGVRAVLCDAETDLDIEAIARAALSLQRTHGIAILPADPGPFTATLVHLMRQPYHLSPLVFGIVCSVMQTSRQQMDVAEAGGHAFIVHYAGQSAAELVAAFEQAPPTARAMLLRTDTASLDPDARVPLYDTLAELFEQAIVRFPSLGGFVLSGGETAGRLLAGFGVRSLRILGEVMPLVALSRIVDGRLAGRYLVTKGGTVGTPSAVVEALGRLYDLLADDPPRGTAHGRAGPVADVRGTE